MRNLIIKRNIVGFRDGPYAFHKARFDHLPLEIQEGTEDIVFPVNGPCPDLSNRMCARRPLSRHSTQHEIFYNYFMETEGSTVTELDSNQFERVICEVSGRAPTVLCPTRASAAARAGARLGAHPATEVVYRRLHAVELRLHALDRAQRLRSVVLRPTQRERARCTPAASAAASAGAAVEPCIWPMR